MRRFQLLIPVYILMLIVIFVLPFFSINDYSILKNTTSHLGAQNTPNAWIMNLIFILLGVASIIQSLIYLKSFWFQKYLLIIFGISLILTAFFQHAPIEPDIPFDKFEDGLHSLFATICGFSFTFFAISSSFIESINLRRIIAIFIGILSTIFSFFIFNIPEFAGIWQRLIFIFSFAWLIFFFDKKILYKNDIN